MVQLSKTVCEFEDGSAVMLESLFGDPHSTSDSVMLYGQAVLIRMVIDTCFKFKTLLVSILT